MIRARAGVRAREEGLGAAEADLKARTDRVAADHGPLAEKRSGAGEEVATPGTRRTALSAEESELEQREERVAEFEVPPGKKEWSESDWWEKQLGRPLGRRRSKAASFNGHVLCSGFVRTPIGVR